MKVIVQLTLDVKGWTKKEDLDKKALREMLKVDIGGRKQDNKDIKLLGCKVIG